MSRLALGTMNFGTDGFHAAYGRLTAIGETVRRRPSRGRAGHAPQPVHGPGGAVAIDRPWHHRVTDSPQSNGRRRGVPQCGGYISTPDDQYLVYLAQS
jgi:hypothetical protein